MNQEKIGKFIAECRKNKKMTQSELAEKLGVSDKTIGNWENGRNMPDLSLFKPLCNELNISINDLLSGEKISKEKYQEKFEENIVNTIDYTNKQITNKNRNISTLLIVFGLLISVTALTMFASESSWGSIYSVIGVLIALVGFSRLTKKHPYHIRLFMNFGFFIALISILFTIDFLGVINIHQAPRFSTYKVSGENMVYYDTPFYDVIRCNINKENEIYKVIKNQKYDKENIQIYCE